MISYSLSMIPGWHTALDVALSLLAKGGKLTIVDFGRQERLPAAFRALLRAWLALFHVKPTDSLEAELAIARGARRREAYRRAALPRLRGVCGDRGQVLIEIKEADRDPPVDKRGTY